MTRPLHLRLVGAFALGLCLAGLLISPVRADEKQGMPDLAQIEQTCLPTSTANLIVWFGKHGYPKLIRPGDPGDEEKDRILHTVHRIMTDTDARFDWGTAQDKVALGIKKYIQEAGYDCDVEYRGLDWTQAENQIKASRGEPLSEDKPSTPFTQDWLQDNNDPNKGFILLLAYCKYDSSANTFTNAWNAGHAVTLVNAEPDMILVHDPAHEEDEPGRKILTPLVLKSGLWREGPFTAPVAGLMLLSGSLLEGPADGQIMLTGAVCITMHPIKNINGTDTPPTQAIAAGGNLGTSVGSSTSPKQATPSPGTPATPSSGSTSSTWSMWIFNILFGK